jgi:hypothetical protein
VSLEEISSSRLGLVLIADKLGEFDPSGSKARVGGDSGETGVGEQGGVLAATRGGTVRVAETVLVLEGGRVGLDPGDEVDLPRRVELLVETVQDIGELEDKLVVVDLDGLVGLGVGEADWEPHRSG